MLIQLSRMQLLMWVGIFGLIFSGLLMVNKYEKLYGNLFFVAQKTTGIVIKKHVIYSTGTRYSGSYRPVLVYHYAINGDVLVSENIDFDGETVFPYEEQASRKIEKYEVGEQVNVYYDKRFNQFATLSLERDYSTLISMLLLIVVSLSMTILGAVFTKRKPSLPLETES